MGSKVKDEIITDLTRRLTDAYLLIDKLKARSPHITADLVEKAKDSWKEHLPDYCGQYQSSNKPLEVGDTVRFRAGGKKMTVIEDGIPGQVRVSHTSERKGITDKWVPVECLERVEK